MDFAFADPRLLFPNITESVANNIEFVINVLYLFGVIVMIIAEWKMFKKFGEKPWKSLIPFYSIYLLYKYTWKKSAFCYYFVSYLTFSICLYAAKYLTQYYPDNDLGVIIILIAIPFGIVMAVCNILSAFRIAESFGKGKGFCVGLVLLYVVFISILGFGKSKYLASNSEDKAIEEKSEVAESSEEAV